MVIQAVIVLLLCSLLIRLCSVRVLVLSAVSDRLVNMCVEVCEVGMGVVRGECWVEISVWPDVEGLSFGL